VTAAQLPSGCRTLLLKVIAESSLQELRQFVDQFLGSNKLVALKSKVSRSVRRGLKHGRDNS
jgi:hypothetical protein